MQIADEMETWFRGRAVDGFLIQPPVLPTGLDDFVDMVIPELQNRGLFRTEYEGVTLRENLGPPRPANQYTSGKLRCTNQPLSIVAQLRKARPLGDRDVIRDPGSP